MSKRIVYLHQVNTAKGHRRGQYGERAYTRVVFQNHSLHTCMLATSTLSKSTVVNIYTGVCGLVRAYKFGRPNAFLGAFTGLTINEAYYVAGVSLTHGGDWSGTANLHVATHIWSFAMGLDQTVPRRGDSHCPCDGGNPPPHLVGDR